MAGIKFLYIRDRKNIQHRKNGTETRGNPIAIVASEIDRECGSIYFAVAATHPKDHFIKDLARHIATERLATIRPREATMSRPHMYDKDNNITPDRGMLTGNNIVSVLATNSGHEITKVIMREVKRLSELPFRFRKVPKRVGELASEWLTFAAIAKAELPTMPQGLPRSKDDNEVVVVSSSLPHA